MKKDPSLSEIKEDEDTIIMSDYLKYGTDGVLRTDGYFCTRLGEIRGVVAFHKKYMQFDAVPSPENEFVVPIPPLTYSIERRFGKLPIILRL